jgi:hypothetical protein
VVECSRDDGDPQPCYASGQRALIRYDEETASIAERVEGGGAVTHRPWSYYPCGLDAPFGQAIIVGCPGEELQTWASIGGEHYTSYPLLDGLLSGSITEKVYVTLASGVTVLTDVGVLSAGSGDPGCSTCIGLIYARLDGVEYGEQAIVVGREQMAPPAAHGLTVSPNPLRDAATLRFALAAPERLTLDVFDVRGRHVRTVALGAHGAGALAVRFEAGDLPAGAYQLRVQGDGGFEASRGVIVLR